MRSILTILFLTIPISLGIWININTMTYLIPLYEQFKEDNALAGYNFHQVPDGLNNYRSAQLPPELLDYVIKKYGIKNVIRLNGDGHDARHRRTDVEVPSETEKATCEKNGCVFNKVSSHRGYVPGQGYTESIKQVNSIMSKGNTLIHCAHGADRTGGMVAAWLKNSGKMTDLNQLWDYTTSKNSWLSLIKNGGFWKGYHKYADGFFPVDKLCSIKGICAPGTTKQTTNQSQIQSAPGNAVLVGGLDYRAGDYKIDKQVELLKSGYGSSKTVQGFRYNTATSKVINFLSQNPKVPIFLFSAGCVKARDLAKSEFVDKSRIYIIEPYGVDANTRKIIQDAVSLGVPASNVFVGSSQARGANIVSGASSSGSNIHWGAVTSVGRLVADRETKGQ